MTHDATCFAKFQACEGGLVYNPKFREYGLLVTDGGSSVIRITFCPWCGVPLPRSLRDAWFDALEARGFDPHDDELPEDLRSDAWWQDPAR